MRKMNRATGKRVWLPGWLLQQVYSMKYPHMSQDEICDHLVSLPDTELTNDLLGILMRNAFSQNAPVPATASAQVDLRPVRESIAKPPISVEDTAQTLAKLFTDDDDD
ncbi:hypothetical protein H6F89_33960 [Cyanobacteria bacterium FACHB-63]|nr:hypothetical protein [Cyanobacteria bacterium FACHB-63]